METKYIIVISIVSLIIICIIIGILLIKTSPVNLPTFIYDKKGKIHRSMDNGKTWKVIIDVKGLIYSLIRGRDNSIISSPYRYDKVAYSTDNGTTFRIINTNMGHSLFDLVHYDKKHDTYIFTYY